MFSPPKYHAYLVFIISVAFPSHVVNPCWNAEAHVVVNKIKNLLFVCLTLSMLLIGHASQETDGLCSPSQG